MIVDVNNYHHHKIGPGALVLNGYGEPAAEVVRITSRRLLVLAYPEQERGGYTMPAFERTTEFTWVEAIEVHGYRFRVEETQGAPTSDRRTP